MEDLREDLINRARQRAINMSEKEHVWANLTNEGILRNANLFGKDETIMSALPFHWTDDRFYLEGVSRVDVRNKIAREVCVNLLMHREFLSTYVPKLIIEKDCFRTENANITKK